MVVVETDAARKIPHCLLTLRFNLAVGRIHWIPGMSGEIRKSEEEDTAAAYPVTLEQALMRLESLV